MTYIITSENELDKVAAPNLPLAPQLYQTQYHDQLNNVLRLYFNRLDALLRQLTSSTPSSVGALLKFPYGAFSSSLTQTTTTNVAAAVTFNTVDFSSDVSVVSNTRITAALAGLYNLQFSVQIQNNHNAPEDVWVWLKQNGTDIAGSTGIVGMPARKNPGDPSHDIKGWNYFLSMNAGDYVEIYWSTTDGAHVTIEFYAASGTPTKPATQSVVATLSFVSGL